MITEHKITTQRTTSCTLCLSHSHVVFKNKLWQNEIIKNNDQNME